MKIALINDTHFGARSNAQWMLDYQKKFYDSVFFPYLRVNNIKAIVHGGDFFDNRKAVDILTLNKTRKMFLDVIDKENIQMYIIPGNHDVVFKNLNDVSSINEILSSYKTVTIINNPSTLDVEGFGITMLPWINSSNYTDFINYIKKDTNEIIYGHLELAGFEMHSGINNEHGMDRSIFRKYTQVWSGHFHQPSEQDNIKYLGAPMEFSWADYGCPRGFSVFDTVTNQLEFVRNPLTLFDKIFYDENKIDINSFPYDDYKSKFVQIHVTTKTDTGKFDKFLNLMYSLDTVDLIVFDTTNAVNTTVSPTFNPQGHQTTKDLMDSYVDNINDENVEKQEIKKILNNLYIEASNL